MLRFVCLALMAVVVSANLEFKDCGHGEVKSVEVSGCDKQPCTLHKGKETVITVEFVPSEDSEKAKIDLVAKVGELVVPIPDIDTNACNFMDCPLKKGETAKLVYKITIPSDEPNVEADLTAKLIGDGDVVLSCGTIHGSIQ